MIKEKICVGTLPRRLRELLTESAPEFFSKSSGIRILPEQFDIPNSFEIIPDDGNALRIRYSDTSSFMTAMGDILSGDIQSGIQTPDFEFRGIMLDSSRGAVHKVEFLKREMIRLALLGMNYFCLYTEDTYEVDGEELFGFARGRYSKQEIRELDAFAEQIGITMFPCMQTLGHMEYLFKLKRYKHLSDTPRIFNVKLEESRAFIEKLILNASEPYKTNLIHLGTDEPYGIGTGAALDFEQPVKPDKLYADHVKWLSGICQKHNLKGIVWGDYLMNSLSGESVKMLPRDLLLDYWNYGGKNKEFHAENIRKAENMGFDLIASPGTWSWISFWCDYEKAVRTSGAFLDAAREAGLKRALTTLWGDDGNEALFETNWGALAFYFASCRGKSGDESFYSKRLEAIGGYSLQLFRLISKMESTASYLPDGLHSYAATPGKLFLYEDALSAFASRGFADDAPAKHFESVFEEIRRIQPVSKRETNLKHLAMMYAKSIVLKYKITSLARRGYLTQNKGAVKRVVRSIANVQRILNKFRVSYRRAWMDERKPQGFELIDMRFGAVSARLDTLKYTLRAYLANEISGIPEFDEKTPEGFDIANMGATFAQATSRSHNPIFL